MKHLTFNQTIHKNLSAEGQALTEYMTILILVSIVSIAAVQSVGTKIQKKIKKATEYISSGIVFEDATLPNKKK